MTEQATIPQIGLLLARFVDEFYRTKQDVQDLPIC